MHEGKSSIAGDSGKPMGAKYPWTSKQLTEAIERCEKDVAGLKEKGADEGLIRDRQHGIDMMKLWLIRAEEHERNAGER